MADPTRMPAGPTSLDAALFQFAVLARLEDGQPMALSEIAAGLGDALALVGGEDVDLGVALAGLAADGLVEPGGGERYRRTAAGARFVALWLAVRPWSELGASGLAAAQAALARERENVERLRTDLLSTVSHELRTPLTLIRTSIGLLLDSTPDDAMRLRLLRNIKQSTDRMNTLVTDLLDLVRLRHEGTTLNMRRVNVGGLLANVETLMRPLIEERDQVMEITTPRPAPVVLGEARRLERLFMNLISNANKYAPAGSRIRVMVVPDDDVVTIAVADTGPGIPADVLPHLFEQFYTARTSSSSHNIGVGLGLPIAQSIAEAHGGRIDVASDVGAGSTFTVTLPRFGSRRRRGRSA